MKPEIKGLLFAIGAGICWGMSGVTGKLLFEYKEITALWLVTLRMLSAGTCMLLWMWHKKKTQIFNVWKQRENRRDQIILGIFGIMMGQVTNFLAVYFSNAGIATALNFTSPIFVLLFCLCVEKRRPAIIETIVLIAVFSGVFLIATQGKIDHMAVTPQALVCGIGSAISISIYNLQPKKLLAQFDLLEVVGWGMLVGGIIMFPTIRFWEVPGIWDYQTVLLCMGVVAYGTIFSYVFFMKSVQLLGAVKASIFSGIDPLVSVFLSVIILGQVFTAMDLLGVSFIFCGVMALTLWDGRKKSVSSETFS